MLYAACVYAASRIQLWNTLPDWIASFYHRFERWWNNSALNVVNWALGWGLVFLLSTSYDWSTQSTRYGVSIAWAIPTFLMHRKVIWPDRDTGPRTAVKWWGYWLISQVQNIGVSYLVVKTSGLPFLLVYVIFTPYTFVAPYFIRDKVVFKKLKTE